MEEAEIKRIERKVDRALESKDYHEAKEQYLVLGAYFSRWEDYENGLDAYKKALSICEREGWELDTAIAQRMIAETYCTLGEYEQAVKYADFYLKYSQKAMNNIEKQRGYATMGRIYFCWAEFLINEKSKSTKKINSLLNKSLSAYEQSLKICVEQLNDIDVREKEEMKSRLFQNLGLVMGSLGRYQEASSNFAIAIQINKTQNFKENLYWCYFNQAEYFYRAGECLNACTYCDLAVKVASSKEEECDALKLKAKACLRMGNILKAKVILREIHKKLQGKDEDVKEQLRITIFLCQIEKKIQAMADTDYQEKKSLYEKKGDAYCALKQYSQGINAYIKMLDFAEKFCKTPKELLPCYTSLAQTYKDDGQYSQALSYCNKELELIDEFSSEGCKTYLFLAELHELLDFDYDTVLNLYQRALKIAEKIDDKVQKSSVLSALIQMETEFGHVREAEKYEAELDDLKRELNDVSDEEGNTENFSCDVDDDELLSDVEDAKPRHYTKRECYKIKRNQKGETELHVAAIKGDANKVKTLIERGHPVNERDLAGWSVMHEACNHGYTDIVTILLDNGANINDPGGEECDGITPLHDAAENGHLEVVKLLLERGACTAVVTNNGDTPLDCLKRWRSRVTLDPEEETEYEETCNALKSNIDTASTKEKRRQLVAVPKTSKTSEPKEVDMSADKPKETSSATELYKSAIEGVRRRHDEIPKPKPIVKSTKPALINEEEVVEDWLDEDMEQSSKRRKVQRSPELCQPAYNNQRPKTPEDINMEMEFEELNLDNWSDASSDKSRSASPVFNVRKNTSVTIDEEPEENKEETEAVKDQPQAEAKEVEKQPEEKKIFVWYKFRVPINGIMILVPVQESDIQNLTVQWLIESSIERYRELYCAVPDILITTGDNAIVSKTEPLSVLVNEQIKTKLLDLKSDSLKHMYIQLVSNHPSVNKFSMVDGEPASNLKISSALNTFETTGDLHLSDVEMTLTQLYTVFHVLWRRKRNVRILDMSRNHLGDGMFDALMEYLRTSSIEHLYLRSTGITSVGIQNFARRLDGLPEENLSKIKCVDLGFNLLRNESVDFLSDICGRLKNLEYLGTEFCRITRPIKNKPAVPDSPPPDYDDNDLPRGYFRPMM